MKRWISLTAALTLGGIASICHSQQTVAPPDPATLVIPQPDCAQPATRPSLGANGAEQAKWQKRVDTYTKCIKDYVKNNETLARQWDAVAQKYLDSNVKVADTFNAYMAEVRKENDEDDGSAPAACPAPTRM
jgi:hypothetical protein